MRALRLTDPSIEFSSGCNHAAAALRRTESAQSVPERPRMAASAVLLGVASWAGAMPQAANAEPHGPAITCRTDESLWQNHG